MQNDQNHPASFRDRSGFVFYQDGILYRQINHSYQQQYDQLINSGLLNSLIEKKLLISHDELETDAFGTLEAYRVIKPEQVRFISSPYEWSFSQLKDAALLTLKIQKKEVARQMYETAKRQGKTASLLEQQRPNVFTMNVANILPGDRIVVELFYTELIVPENRQYEFVYPTVVGPRYSNTPEATAPPSGEIATA